MVAFSVKADRQVVGLAATSKVPVLLENVIYRLVEQVTKRAEDLLAPIIEYQVLGEATVQEIFDISVTGKANLKVAGSRVSNGSIERKEIVKVLRNGTEVFQGQYFLLASPSIMARRPILKLVPIPLSLSFAGTIDTLKRVRTDVNEVGKGTECGINIHGFTELAVGDTIQVRPHRPWLASAPRSTRTDTDLFTFAVRQAPGNPAHTVMRCACIILRSLTNAVSYSRTLLSVESRSGSALAPELVSLAFEALAARWIGSRSQSSPDHPTSQRGGTITRGTARAAEAHLPPTSPFSSSSSAPPSSR